MQNSDNRKAVKAIHELLQARRNYFKKKLKDCYDFTTDMIAKSRAKLESPHVTHPADVFSASFDGNYEIIAAFERDLASLYVICLPEELALTSDEFANSLADTSQWLRKTNLILDEQIGKWTGVLTQPTGVSFIQHSQARIHLKGWVDLSDAIKQKIKDL